MPETPHERAERFMRYLEPLQGSLAAFCRRSLRRPGDAADVLQSAIAEAFRTFDLYAEGTNFRAWIFRFVSYAVLNRNRAVSRQQEVELPDDIATPRPAAGVDESLMDRLLDDPEPILDECDEALMQALLKLPDRQRNIFLLRAVGDFSYREIAEAMEVPLGTVMGLLSRSRERLRGELLEYARTHGLLPREGGD